jgi:hypothetical protein
MKHQHYPNQPHTKSLPRIGLPLSWRLESSERPPRKSTQTIVAQFHNWTPSQLFQGKDASHNLQCRKLA